MDNTPGKVEYCAHIPIMLSLIIITYMVAILSLRQGFLQVPITLMYKFYVGNRGWLIIERSMLGVKVAPVLPSRLLYPQDRGTRPNIQNGRSISF
jgi:hypothetical protein